MIVQLGFSKRATFNLLTVLPTSFIFAKVRLNTLLSICDIFLTNFFYSVGFTDLDKLKFIILNNGVSVLGISQILKLPLLA
jgi:hypothetical protein